MPAEHIRPGGGLYQGYFCLKCGKGGLNMVATGHNDCEPNPELVAQLIELNR